MTSPLQDIANTLATDFREAVIDAERADMETIDQIIRDMNEAYKIWSERDDLLSGQSEQAVRTLMEIEELRKDSLAVYQRRVAELRKTLAEFRDTKIAAKEEALGNVVKLEKMAEKA